MAGSISLPDLIKAIRGQIPNDKCDLLEDLVKRIQTRKVQLNRQQFLHCVREIAGDDAPALRQALKQLAVDRTQNPGSSAQVFSDLAQLQQHISMPTVSLPPSQPQQQPVSLQQNHGQQRQTPASFLQRQVSTMQPSAAQTHMQLQQSIGLPPQSQTLGLQQSQAIGLPHSQTMSLQQQQSQALGMPPSQQALGLPQSQTLGLQQSQGSSGYMSVALTQPQAFSHQLSTSQTAATLSNAPPGHMSAQQLQATHCSQHFPLQATAAHASLQTSSTPSAKVSMSHFQQQLSQGNQQMNQFHMQPQQQLHHQQQQQQSSMQRAMLQQQKQQQQLLQHRQLSERGSGPHLGDADAVSTDVKPQHAEPQHPQKRLEVAAAAVLVHAAGCNNPQCQVPHCDKMKKIHHHFLQCNSKVDCSSCKKLKPLMYIHAKHCTAEPDQCPIAYCTSAKLTLAAMACAAPALETPCDLNSLTSLCGGAASKDTPSNTHLSKLVTSLQVPTSMKGRHQHPVSSASGVIGLSSSDISDTTDQDLTAAMMKAKSQVNSSSQQKVQAKTVKRSNSQDQLSSCSMSFGGAQQMNTGMMPGTSNGRMDMSLLHMMPHNSGARGPQGGMQAMLGTNQGLGACDRNNQGMPTGGEMDIQSDTKMQARLLLVLAHVMKCQLQDCPVPECGPTKQLVKNHTRTCRVGDACPYPRCALSKRLMRHHRECIQQECPICLPLRRQLAAAKQGSNPSKFQCMPSSSAPNVGNNWNFPGQGALPSMPSPSPPVDSTLGVMGIGGFGGGMSPTIPDPLAGQKPTKKKASVTKKRTKSADNVKDGSVAANGNGKRGKKAKLSSPMIVGNNSDLPALPASVSSMDPQLPSKTVFGGAGMSESDLSVMDGVMDTDSFLQEDLDLSSFNSMPIAPSVVGSVAPKKATKRDTVSNEGTDADILEVGFKVDVLASKANDDLLSNRKEWHSGTVVQVNRSGLGSETYDVQLQDLRTIYTVNRSLCRLVCYSCSCYKLLFKPSTLFCDKCLSAIHSRWRYWEEPGEEGGAKLCHRCFSDLSVASSTVFALKDSTGRLVDCCNFVEKKDKDRPEYVDNWVSCDHCHRWYHWVCAMFKGEGTAEDVKFYCENCQREHGKTLPKELVVPSAKALPTCTLGRVLEETVHQHLIAAKVKCEPVTVRVVSCVETKCHVHEELRNRDWADGFQYPEYFPYRSKCILGFQKVDGFDVCFFAMYVQEYGSNCPEPNRNRVYISYLDSVRFFESEPDGHRSTVYHAILCGYLAQVKAMGFNFAHIWVAPPKAGDDYIFHAHPEEMNVKRMGLMKLKSWYELMLEKAKALAIVHDYQEMPDEYKDLAHMKDIPMFVGDHWQSSVALKLSEHDKKLSKASGINLSELNRKPMLAPGHTNSILEALTDEMKSMRNHFIIVTLSDPTRKSENPTEIIDMDPIRCNAFVDSRQSFLETCQMNHWQFNYLRHAQHSTMMLLWHLHHNTNATPQPKNHKITPSTHHQQNVQESGPSSLANPNTPDTPDVNMEALMPDSYMRGNGIPTIPASTLAPASTGAAALNDSLLSGSAMPPACPDMAMDAFGLESPGAGIDGGGVGGQVGKTRTHKIELAMSDWSELLKQANEAAQAETWELPPEELFIKILGQINPSKRDILLDRYYQCKSPNTTPETRSVFIRVLRRIAESFMSCLLAMQAVPNPS